MGHADHVDRDLLEGERGEKELENRMIEYRMGTLARRRLESSRDLDRPGIFRRTKERDVDLSVLGHPIFRLRRVGRPLGG